VERRQDQGPGSDPHPAGEQAAAKAAARERRDACVRGHQLAEMRATTGMTLGPVATITVGGCSPAARSTKCVRIVPVLITVFCHARLPVRRWLDT
jgi:hypothetical protein